MIFTSYLSEGGFKSSQKLHSIHFIVVPEEESGWKREGISSLKSTFLEFWKIDVDIISEEKVLSFSDIVIIPLGRDHKLYFLSLPY